MTQSLLRLARLIGPKGRWDAFMVVSLALVVAAFDVIGLSIVPVFAALVAVPGELPPGIPEGLRAFLDSLGRTQALLLAALALGGVFLLKAVATVALGWLQGRFVQNQRVSIGGRLFNHYLTVPYAEASRKHSGEQLRNLMSEVKITVSQALSPTMQLFAQLPVALGVIAVVTMLAPGEALAAIALLGSTTWLLLRVILSRLRGLAVNAQQARRDVASNALEAFTGQRDVRVYRLEHFFAQRIHGALFEQGRLLRRQLLYNAVLASSMEVAAIAGVLGMLAVLVLSGREGPDVVATISLFAIALTRLRQVFTKASSALTALRQGVVASDLVCDLLLGREDRMPTAGDDEPFEFEELKVSGLHFRYLDSEREALSGINLTIRRGETIGIVGPTGSGKSTLLDVLLGLLEPTKGRFLLNGGQVALKGGAWRRSIGLVPQQVHLLDDTLAFNITLNADDVNSEHLLECVHSAMLDDVVAELPEGLQTRLGERGQRLSGGQRQRVAIARALYRNPAVFVFDEATAALDNAAERYVMEAIARLRGRTTTIAVAHRLSSLRDCDRIICLEHGRIAAEGSFEALMQGRLAPTAGQGSDELVAAPSVAKPA